MNQYVMYLRKSRADREAESRGEGETLTRHEKALLETAKRMNLPISQIYKEIVSGETIASRPVMTRLLGEVEQGMWTGVLVMEIERLARGDTIDQGIVAQAFKFSNTKIVTPMKVYDPNDEFDEEYFEFGLYMSRREYKTINRRLQNGRIASAKEGKYVGNKPPFGYERVKLQQDKGFTLKPIQEQADIVKIIFHLYAFGEDGNQMGVSLIVKKLNSLKIPSPKGADWTNSTVQGILSNPVYIGKIKWNERKTIKKVVNGTIVRQRPRAKEYLITEGLHEPIIDETIFQKVSEKRKRNPPRPINTLNTIKNPLSGLVFCSECGRSMVRRPYPNRKDALICPYTTCKTVSSDLDLVEEKVLTSLNEILLNVKLKADIAVELGNIDFLSNKKSILATKEKELFELLQNRDKIYEFLEKGVYDNITFIDRLEKNKDSVQSLQIIIQRLKTEVMKESNNKENLKKFVPKCETLLSCYDKLSVAEKNDILKELIQKIIYIKDTKNKRNQSHIATFQLHIYPKIYKQS